MSTPTTDRDATVRQLAETGASHRAIARQLGIHHNTVARIVRATPNPVEHASPEPERATTEPHSEPEHATDAPPTPTSGDPRATRLIHDFPKWLIQDLNILGDPFTSRLPEPLERAIHAAAAEKRARMRAAFTTGASHRATKDVP